MKIICNSSRGADTDRGPTTDRGPATDRGTDPGPKISDLIVANERNTASPRENLNEENKIMDKPIFEYKEIHDTI
jgi:hypothetical protein